MAISIIDVALLTVNQAHVECCCPIGPYNFTIFHMIGWSKIIMKVN